jgi:hypothetical protein
MKAAYRDAGMQPTTLLKEEMTTNAFSSPAAD